MTDEQRTADSIDMELYRLACKAYREWDRTKSADWRELSQLLDAARSKSLSMLPESRRVEIVGI